MPPYFPCTAAVPAALGTWLIAASGIAAAQAPMPPDAPRARTGPDASPPSLPAFPTTTPPPALPETAPLADAPAPSGAVLLGDVEVTTEGEGANARPRKGWKPLEDAISNLRVDARPGERLDAAWVRRQFVDNRLIGVATGFDRVMTLVQDINRAFLQNGYVNSGLIVAAQEPPANGGTLRLRLIYGGLAPAAPDKPAVSVAWSGQGAKGLSADYVRHRLPAASRAPFSAIDLERDFRLLAEDPAIQTVSADLRPGSRAGEATLLLTVDPQPRFDGYVTVANSRSPSVGGERAAIGGSSRNMLAPGDLLTGEFGVTSGVTDGVVGYTVPFLSPRVTMSLRGSVNNAAVVDRTLRDLDIKSRDWAVEGGPTLRVLNRPLLPSTEAGRWTSARTATIGVLLAHRRTRNSLLGMPFAFSPGSVDGRTEYTALRLSGDWIERNVDRVVTLSFTGTMGLDGTRSDEPTIPSPRRNFKAALLQLNYARRLAKQGLEFRGRVTGQWSDSILYSAERLSVGGEYSVRGYRENFLLADKGVYGSVELSQPFSIAGGQRDAAGKDWGAFSVSAFVDGGTVRNVRSADPSPRTLASVGASLAWVPFDAIFARITYGRALTGRYAGDSRDLQDRGFQFRITVRPLALFR